MDETTTAITTRLAGRSSRRALLATAAKTGALSAAVLAAGGVRSLPAGARALLQDGGGTLVVAIPQATVQLDPAIAGSNGYGDIIPVTDNVTEGLTRFKPGTVEIEPALAESWETSEDGLTWTFAIRPGVTFHDGTPLDAKAVETNILRQIDEEHPLHQEGMVYAGIAFADVESTEATGDLELTVTLTRPSILLPGNLAIFAAGIVSPAWLEAGADATTGVVGTGPFKVDAWTRDVQLDLVANDDYWGGRPALDRVIFRTVPEDTVRLSELQTGSIDVANQIDFKDATTIEGDPNLQLITGGYLNVQFLAFNQAHAPFDSLEVRQAVSQAINKQNIADAVFYGRYTLGAGPIAPPLPGYDASFAEAYPFDQEAARAAIDAAGAAGASFDLYVRNNSFWPLIGQLVQADLAAVGLTANLQTLEDADFFSTLATGSVPAFINDWTWDNGDPDNVMSSLFVGDRAVSRLGYDDPDVAALIEEAQVTADPAARTQLYLDAQRAIVDDAVWVTLGYPERGIGARAAVQGLVVSPVGSVVLREVTLTS